MSRTRIQSVLDFAVPVYAKEERPRPVLSAAFYNTLVRFRCVLSTECTVSVVSSRLRRVPAGASLPKTFLFKIIVVQINYTYLIIVI